MTMRVISALVRLHLNSTSISHLSVSFHTLDESDDAILFRGMATFMNT